MAVGKEIKNQIKSIKNTQKITSAMEMVAASKMKKAQGRMVAARPYVEKLGDIISHLVYAKAEYKHDFMTPRDEIKRVGYIIVSSDRGLCGGLNTNLFRAILADMRQWQQKNSAIEVCALGNKAISTFTKLSDVTMAAALKDLGDAPALDTLIGNITVMLDKYTAGEIDALYVGYNFFENTMSQKPTIKQVLPVIKEAHKTLSNKDHHWDYLYEPDAQNVLSALLLRFVETTVYQGVVENIACEQSARMVAMKSATDNAGEMVDELELIYNKARQAAITQEISEIVGGAAAV